MKLVKHSKAKPVPMVPVSRSWPPFWPLSRLQKDIDRLFEDPFTGWLAPTGPLAEAWGPAVDVHEDKNTVFVTVELPGMTKEQIDVNLDGDTLNISGERTEETEHKDADTCRRERYFGRFHRAIALPAAVDPKKIEAHYKDGILTVTCPKTDEARRKEIEIKIN